MAERPTDSADFKILCGGVQDVVVMVTGWLPISDDPAFKPEDAMRLRSLAKKLWAAADWVEDDG